ncbi:hypothetical protein HDU98_000609 [Podochytrium sp. JEL0797]|nr:hypothetical protein HDU98_000609 [Podochytrium sp. JEL0797]
MSIGISIVIAMNLASSFGVNAQALAIRRLRDPATPVGLGFASSETDDESATSPLLGTPSMRSRWSLPRWADRWLWHIGFVCYIIPQLFGSILALNFISPILLAPLGASGLIFNVFFSSWLVGTPVGPWDWVATALIVLGGIIVSMFGNVDVEIHDFETFFKLFESPMFMTYYAAISTVMFGCLLGAVALETRKRDLIVSANRMEDEDEGGIEAESRITGLRTGAVAFDSHIGILFASCGGISAAMTLTIVKCGLNLVAGPIVAKVSSQSQANGLLSIFLVVALVVSVLMQLVTLNKAIVFISPLIAIPVFYTFFTSLSVSNTLVVVFSIPGLELPAGIEFTIEMAVVGVSIIVGAVWVLSYSSMKGSK